MPPRARDKAPAGPDGELRNTPAAEDTDDLECSAVRGPQHQSGSHWYRCDEMGPDGGMLPGWWRRVNGQALAGPSARLFQERLADWRPAGRRPNPLDPRRAPTDGQWGPSETSPLGWTGGWSRSAASGSANTAHELAHSDILTRLGPPKCAKYWHRRGGRAVEGAGLEILGGAFIFSSTYGASPSPRRTYGRDKKLGSLGEGVFAREMRWRWAHRWAHSASCGEAGQREPAGRGSSSPGCSRVSAGRRAGQPRRSFRKA